MLEIEIFLIKPAHELNYVAVLNERNEMNFLGKARGFEKFELSCHILCVFRCSKP